MAPPPEYDKEPKAPDKSTTNISTEDTKLLHNLINDQHTNLDHKPANTAAAVEVENNKHVETLDDGQLRALLDEAITYKCPKDREGKSSLFKELLEEVEQDEQACEAAARTLSGCRGARRGARGRRALPHSNSLQDLVAALAAEPAPRRAHVRPHAPAPAPSTVSARATHGGSLPSGVDTSSLLSEEPTRGAGYLATVRCVNPPPLAERRVSASDANTPSEMELLNRRSKPMFPMTYTARATLEIGSGSVCSGRAVTTTTPSNQVRTPVARPYRLDCPDRNQTRLMNALRPKNRLDDGGGMNDQLKLESARIDAVDIEKRIPRGPIERNQHVGIKEDRRRLPSSENTVKASIGINTRKEYPGDSQWADSVNNWYKSLSNYADPLQYTNLIKLKERNIRSEITDIQTAPKNIESSKFMEKKFVLPFAITSRDNYSSPDLCLRDDLDNLKCDLPENNKVEDFKANESLSFSAKRYYDEGAHRVESYEDNKECDIKLRKKYRKQVGEHLVVATLSEINPRNVRRMTIGLPLPHIQLPSHTIDTHNRENRPQTSNLKKEDIARITCPKKIYETSNSMLIDVKGKLNDDLQDANMTKSSQLFDSSTKCNNSSDEENEITFFTNPFVGFENDKSEGYEVELTDLKPSHSHKSSTEGPFAEYLSKQQRLLDSIEKSKNNKATTEEYAEESNVNVTPHCVNNVQCSTERECSQTASIEEYEMTSNTSKPEDEHTTKSDRIILTQLPNNAYIILTLPKPIVLQSNSNVDTSVQLLEIENNNEITHFVSEFNNKPNIVKKKKQKMPPEHRGSSDRKKSALDNNMLRVLLFKSLFKNNASENLSHNSGVSAITNDEVDSAISFSCITTPEVVSSCNTTSSTAQAAVAVDAKPRSVVSSSFNGLPLSRPNYGSTGTSASEDYKLQKSLDENGNSVQGFSSPLSGSSQHKKPRRKKSSKNETVIDCQQIDGYQGDKDVNELLRFIESNADNGRGPKLGRVKHKDDTDDKSGKKRSTERRKDKENKIKRATSLEELSRTKIEDLTDVAESPLRGDKKERRDAPTKAERRSWGDDALYSDPPDPPVAELTDFQTVTKKRKPRRRADDPPRRARAPSPRPRRESAPPSDRSNDSNDDMDSVHSLPPAPPPPPPAAPLAPVASYADIARTRHNIPDLIESCNFYAEGEGGPAAAPPDADGYPALERAAAAARRLGKPAPRPARKERAPPPPPAPAPPAPDVVADRRPPVILLDSAARPRDMDGVTFGFDINEQLLSGAARRPRCDLLRDAPEPGGGGGEGGGAGVAVRAGCAALRYVPPDAPPDTQHLLQIVDYVGAAWEDAVRGGGGKVRYFSE